MISRLLDTPFSFTCHAHDIFYDTTMLDLKIINAKACFAISEYNRRHISKLFPHLPKEKLQLLHCGIDPGRFPFLERGKIATKLRILSVGRLMPTKGFDDLIRSCKILKDKGIDFICDIVGDGPMEAGLRQLLEDLDLKIQVNLRGPLPQEDIIRLYQEADIFVLASRKTRHRDVQDGIPVVLMEAMASGIPVISTRISGIPELIEDTVTGILVCPEDLIGLSKAIERIYFDTEYAGRLARNARARVEKEYDISISADKLIATISPPYA
jgi:glycosyltransferase involved in cell wall biosynthesis